MSTSPSTQTPLAPLTSLADIEQLPFTITYMGADDKQDNWLVQATNPTTHAKESFPFMTGFGLRERKYHVNGKELDPIRKARYDSRPPKPKIADVVYCLLGDASAADMNFDEWCSEYGYSSDSIKALGVYKECLNVAKQLSRLFTRDQLKAMRELLQDY